MWKINENTYNSHDILGAYPIYEVMDLFQRELMVSNTQKTIVLDILFTGVNFSIFTRDTIEFYLDVFGTLLAHYFDSHSDKDKRSYCENIIRSLEDKIIAIKEEKKVIVRGCFLSIITVRVKCC